MYNKKRHVDLYPEFTADLPDNSHAVAEVRTFVRPAVDAPHKSRIPSTPLPNGRRLRIFASSVLGLVLIAASAWGINELLKPGSLPLRAVRIEGAFTHLTPEDVQQAIAGAASGGFLYADVNALRQAALGVPWVRSVNVRRVWPDTLRVNITEHAAAARWGEQGLLSREGKVFTPKVASYPPGLPELHGPDGTQALVLSQYRAMNKAIAPLNLHIKRINLDARRAWRLSLSNGIELLLGRAGSDAHLQRFVQVYPSLLTTPAGGVIERVDMRYGNGLAVRWGKN